MKVCLRLLTLILSCSYTLSAKTHVVISIDDFSWFATHIVVVTEGDEIDGQVTVLESWQGDLKPGDSLNISELAKFKSQESRHIECLNIVLHLGKCSDTTPEFVSGSRIILFLRNLVRQSGSANWHSIGAAWIEQGEAYGLWDGDRAWDGIFAKVGSEGSVRDAIEKVTYEKQGLKRALMIEEREARLRALQPFLGSSVDYTAMVASVETSALKRWAGQLTASQKHSRDDITVLKCSEDCAGAIFALLLKRELEFWRDHAQGLKIDWWNQETDWEVLKVYRTQFSNTQRALAGLKATGHRGSAGLVRELRAYWLSLPQLKNQPYVVRDCDAFLKSL